MALMKETDVMKKRTIDFILLTASILFCSCFFPRQVLAAKITGKYPVRKGTILVTSDAYKGLIPTGHAAMVWNEKK